MRRSRCRLTVSAAAATPRDGTHPIESGPGPGRRRAERPLGLSRAAALVWPYAQLARWDRPIGWQLLLWPCWWSAALAASAFAAPRRPLLSLLPAPSTLVLFLVGAVAMRGAGCTYNDIVDGTSTTQSSARVRGRCRPGQVTRRQAGCSSSLQALVGLAVLLHSTALPILLGLCSLAVVADLSVHEADHQLAATGARPCLFLGRADGLGSGVRRSRSARAVMLYIGSILWVIGYDTIYAHQDKEDDALVGVRSTARLFGDNTKIVAGRALWRRAGLLCRRLRLGARRRCWRWPDWSPPAPIWPANRDSRYRRPGPMPPAVQVEQQVGWLIFLGLIGGACGWR